MDQPNKAVQAIDLIRSVRTVCQKRVDEKNKKNKGSGNKGGSKTGSNTERTTIIG